METKHPKLQLFEALFFLSTLAAPLTGSAAVNETMTQQSTQQQRRQLTGIVTDELGEPLMGATVLVRGTNDGVATDMNGRFTISTAAADPVVVVSYIGYETQEIAMGSRAQIEVKLLPAGGHQIQEVVVTAMGILRKEKSLTYATQQVKAEDLMKVQDVNVANSLEGKISGVTITPSAGGAGGASKIQLRGAKSIMGGSSPLIVVDGVPMTNDTRGQITDANNMTETAQTEGADPLSMINPDDIESINVLKGANAAALYGSRAANGVVMITTKKGRAGKMQVSYTGNLTFDTPLLLPKIQQRYGTNVDQAGYLGEPNGWGARVGDSPLQAKARATADKIPYERTVHLRNHGADNLSDFYRTGVTANNSVAVSGGTELVQSYVSVANSHALGLVETNNYNRNTFAFRQTYRLWDRLTLNASINYVQTKTRNRVGGGTVGNPIYHLYTTPQNIDMGYYRDNYALSEGTWLSEPQGHYAGSDEGGFTRQNDVATLKGPMMNWPYMDARQNNPYWLLHQNWSTQKNDRIYGGFHGMLDIYDGLSLQARFNFDHDKYQEEGARYATTFAPASMYDFGTYNERRDQTTEMYLDFLLSYNKQLTDDWGLSATAGWVGHTAKGSNYGTYLANATYYDPLNQQLATDVNLFNPAYGDRGVTTDSETSNWDRAWIATAQVGWREKVYLDASYRSDQYRVFKQWKNLPQHYDYWGVGANALLNELLSLPSWWNYAKLRMSYSEVGNAVPNRYYNMATGSRRTGAVTATSGTLFDNAEPERTHSFETGLEMLFLDNRLSFDLTYYYARVTGLYMPIGNTGGITVYDNSAKLRNQGLEATAAYNFRFGADVRWRTQLNVSFNDNRIETVGYDEAGRQKQVFTDVAGVRVRFLEGDSYGDMYVRDLRRNDDGTIFLSEGGNIMKQQRYTNFIGNMYSKWQLGWTNTLNYRDFQLSMLINGRIGGKVISLTEAYLDEMGLSDRTADARDAAVAQGLYTASGEPAMQLPDGSGRLIGVRNYYQVMGARGSQYSPLYVYDAINFRLRELSLAYTFRSLFGEGKDLGVSLIARNLFFIYKKAPVDPDVSLSTAGSLAGFELFNMPSTRSYGLNLKLTL